MKLFVISVVAALMVIVSAGLMATKYYPLAALIGPGVLFLVAAFRYPWLAVFALHNRGGVGANKDEFEFV